MSSLYVLSWCVFHAFSPKSFSTDGFSSNTYKFQLKRDSCSWVKEAAKNSGNSKMAPKYSRLREEAIVNRSGVKCKRQRDKRAGGKVQQQEPRAPSHFDSSSFCMSPGVDCKPQSPRPDREAGVSVEDRCESGCTQRGALQQRTGTWRENMLSPFSSFYACSINHCISWESYSPKNQEVQFWIIVLVHFVMSWIITYGYTCQFCYPSVIKWLQEWASAEKKLSLELKQLL